MKKSSIVAPRPLTLQEAKDVQRRLTQWSPPLFPYPQTPITDGISSPSQDGQVYGLLGGLVCGLVVAKKLGRLGFHPSFDVTVLRRSLIGICGIGGGLLTGIGAAEYRTRRNSNLLWKLQTKFPQPDATSGPWTFGQLKQVDCSNENV